MNARCLLFLGAGLALVACSDAPLDVPSAGERDASATQRTNIDALRAIGYAGVSEESVDEHQTGVQIHDRERSQPGYNLYTVRPLCLVVLMDAEGNTINKWQRAGDRAWSNAQLLPDGDLLVIGQEKSTPYIGAVDEHRYLLRLGWNGEERWRADLNAHHDVEQTPDGQLALLSFKRTLDSEHAPAGAELREDSIQLLDMNGAPLEQRSIFAALSAPGADYELGEVAVAKLGGVSYVDLVHANSLEFMQRDELAGEHPIYAPGNVLVSMRHQDALMVMRWETGELVWSWGHGELLGPHDATLLEGGNLLIFDNGLGRGWSRVIELDPRTERIVWEYRTEPREDFYSASRGSAQRLANGNTLIAESDKGRAFEVTPQGETVWSWLNPDLAKRRKVTTVVRMKRLPLDYVDAIRAAR